MRGRSHGFGRWACAEPRCCRHLTNAHSGRSRRLGDSPVDGGYPPGGLKAEGLPSEGQDMIEIRNILCPVDLSDSSKRALDHAIAIARRYESRIIVLLHVGPGVPALAFAGGISPLEPTVLTDADRERLMAELRPFTDGDEPPGVPIQPM